MDKMGKTRDLRSRKTITFLSRLLIMGQRILFFFFGTTYSFKMLYKFVKETNQENSAFIYLFILLI